uniref:RCC1-like domain-containing protein n=1 Tax=Globisporangium ultimum (strain ATCC 200006 / CBS 805.95 / DAOM BR144) TaxID=431595 RepID=K3X668_GLOUD
MGIQVVFSLFASILDQASSSLTQKKEFLAELLPLIKSLPPQALAPTNCSIPSSLPGAAAQRGLTATASAATSDSRELVDKIQRFLLGVCPLPSLKPGPSSPKVYAVAPSLNDFDVTDRTNAVNGLIYLAAARSSLRDFLIAMKVILGALESCCDANDTHSARLSSPLTTAVPLLKPKGEDQHPTNSAQSEWEKDEVAGKYKSKMDISSLDLKPGAARQRGDILASGKGVEHEISHSAPHDLVIQVKRKALPKGFVPKAIGTTSTTTALNVSLAHHRPSGSQGAGVTNATTGVHKSKMKEDLKELRQSGSTGFSLDISMMEDSGSRDAFAVAINYAQTVKCPKLKPLNISSVLHQLDGAKASMPPKPTRFPRGTQQSSSSMKYEDVCSTSGIVLGDGMMLPGQDDCEDKEVWSCGQNSYGELGHGDTITRKSFDRIEALQRKDVVQVSAGNEHSIVLCGDGTVLTCGYNDNGQCGVGVTNRVSNVTEIHKFGDHAISQVHAYNGCEHSVVVTQDGKAATFGYNYRGQLGHGNTTSENVPKLIRSLEGKIVRLVSCSYYHTILTCEDAGAGRQFVYTFGRNDYGQLGHNDTIDRKVPHQIDALAEQQIVSVACGQYHTMVVSSTGKAYGFGKNDYGQLGTESAENQLVPVQVRNGLEKQMCLEIRCGYYHTIVLCSGAHLYGFGRNDYGQLGLGKANATAAANLQLQQQRFASPQLIEELEGKEIIRFACGCYHTIAVSDNGVLFVFGRNNHGQLGTGDTNERLYPFPIEYFLGKRIAMVAAGFYHTIVLTGGKEEEKTDQDGEPGNMGDENVDGNLREPSVLCSSSILLTNSVRHILDTSKSALSGEVGSGKLEKERAADQMEDSEDPSCDPDDEDCRDEDDRRRKAGVTVDNTPDLTDKSVQHGVDSVDAAVIIFAELDRLCKPFLPKTGSYPILQHPSNTAMEAFRSTIQASPPPNIDLCAIFDGCFEANVIHVCSSTFESLCTLLKHLSGRKIESLAHAQLHLQAAPQNGAQLQVYMLFVCLRLLQANLAQLLRSGLGKATMLFTMGRDTAMEIYDQAYAAVQGDPRFTTLEIERMLAAIRQIRETLMALVGLKQRASSFLSADTEANNGEIVARIASDAVDTLMLGFELFFPCTCTQRQFFLHVIESRPEISKGDCACEGKVHLPTPGSHPKSRKLLLGPLLRRMAEDSLILKFLPLAARDPLFQVDSSTKPNLSSISLIYTALLERIATEFTRALGEATNLQGGSSAMAADNSRHPPLTFEPSLFNLLLVLQKHIAAWASSRTRWERKAHGHAHQALSMMERVAVLTDHVIRVDAKEKDDIPLPWQCFIEFSLATLSQCCEVFRQVIFQESVPSPSFGHKYQDPSFAAGNEEIMIDNAFVEIVEASIVGQLLPSLVSSLLVFSSNPLFAATLFPSVKNLLRFLDDFNQHNQAIKDMENNRRGGHGGLISAAGAQSNSISGRRKQSGTLRLDFGRESELNASGVKRGSIGDVICLPWSFLLEKDLAVLAAEMAVTLKIGDPFFTFENSQAAAHAISDK